MDQNEKNRLIALKNEFDFLGLMYIQPSDKKVIDYVIRSLSEFDTGAYVSVGNVSVVDAIKGGLQNIKIFGDTNAAEVFSIIKGIPFLPTYPDSRAYTCFISYSSDSVTQKVDRNSAKVLNYKTPIKPDVLGSFYLGHEFVHTLKDTNYEEYIDTQILGDTIPIFYEMLMADKHPMFKRTIFRFRLEVLKQEAKNYERAIRQMGKSNRYKDLHKINATMSGQYLNSFYYAILLFNIYKVEPKMILEMVNKVLKHELTTRKMLDNLGLLYQDKNSVFDTEFEEVKKSL